jgi:hypothetical protein
LTYLLPSEGFLDKNRLDLPNPHLSDDTYYIADNQALVFSEDYLDFPFLVFILYVADPFIKTEISAIFFEI